MGTLVRQRKLFLTLRRLARICAKGVTMRSSPWLQQKKIIIIILKQKHKSKFKNTIITNFIVIYINKGFKQNPGWFFFVLLYITSMKLYLLFQNVNLTLFVFFRWVQFVNCIFFWLNAILNLLRSILIHCAIKISINSALQTIYYKNFFNTMGNRMLVHPEYGCYGILQRLVH